MEVNEGMLTGFRAGWTKPVRQSIWRWAENNIVLPPSYAIAGRLSFDRSKYLKPVFEALKDYNIRQVVVVAAVQTGKSLIADCYVPYILCNDASSVLWMLQDDDFAKKYAESRIGPIMHANESIRRILPTQRWAAKKNSIIFPNGVILNIAGANLGNAQSFSYRYVVLDEVWMYRQGIVREAIARTTAFPRTSKVLLLSQSGEVGDDLDMEFQKGTQEEWGWKCPKCGHEQPYFLNKQRPDGSWAGLLWDRTDKTKPNGKYNYVELAKTLRLECFQCRNAITDTPANRRLLNDSGVYIATNNGADPSIRSFRWNAFANPDISFAYIATKYLMAKQAQKEGYDLPLREFYQKIVATAWTDSLSADIHAAIIEAYDVNSDWPDEAFRFFTVDCQKDFVEFWGVIRSWSKSGESRLLWRGRMESWAQVRDIQQQFKVKDQHVFIDSGFEATKVYAECVKNGHEGTINNRKVYFCWVALKGSDSQDFTHYDVGKRIKDKRIYSPMGFGNPSLGTAKATVRCPLFLWSNPSCKDILKRHRDGKASKWVVPTKDEEYDKQLNAEFKKKVVDKRSGREKWMWVQHKHTPNHYFDCEAMQIAAAAIANILGSELTTRA